MVAAAGGPRGARLRRARSRGAAGRAHPACTPSANGRFPVSSGY
eukprot:COSAG02_NODE_1541_length_12013_cov_16.409182_15_plen_44_part_00